MISLVGPRWRDVTPQSVGSGAPRDDDVRSALARTKQHPELLSGVVDSARPPHQGSAMASARSEPDRATDRIG